MKYKISLPSRDRIFPFIRWFPLSGSIIRGDLIAGIIGALVLVPKAMAYAQLSGLPVYHGLYAAFIPAIVGALWGSSRQLLTGPVAVVSLMTAAALAPLAVPGSEDYVGLALLLALLVGLIQLGMGVFKFGTIVNFLSHPVVIGFINAAAIIIGLSQLNKLLGIPLESGDVFLMDVLNMLLSIGQTHIPTLLVGLLAFAIMILMKKFTPPAIARTNVLVAVIATTVLSFYIGFENNKKIHSDQIADESARTTMEKYIQLKHEIETLTSDITQKSAEMRKMESMDSARGLLSKRHDIDILKLEEESKEKEKKLRKSEFQKMRFERVPGQGDAPDLFYLKGQVPSGLKSDGVLWFVKKVEKDEIKMMGGGDVVGKIPEGLPALSIPNLSWDGIFQLLSAAFVIALVAFMESISMAKALAARTRQKVEPNQELIGQGLANISGSFFQSYPVTGSFTGSAINLDAGAKTGLASVFNGLFVAVTLIALTPLLYYLPTTVLSAIIIMAVGSLLNFKAIKRTWHANKNDGIVAVVSFASTLLFAPHLDRGVLLGAGLALVLYLYRTMQPRVAILARHKDGTLRDAVAHKLELCKEISMVRFDGQLYFANTAFFEETVLDRLASKPGLKFVIVSGSGINNIDATSEEMLHHLSEQLRKQEIEILFCGLKQQVVNVLMNTGLYAQIGENHFFRTEDQALEYAWEKLGNNHSADCPLKVVRAIEHRP